MICSALVSSLFGTIVWSFALLSVVVADDAGVLAGSLTTSAVEAERTITPRAELPNGVR